ncbi:MAG: bacteriorhodopsin-like [Actinobacteria bacterium]|nr:bacteriorhodopsin-like [Actinomycetota bacterium]
MTESLKLTEWQFDLVYNSFSLTIAAMGAALLFFILMRNQVSRSHQTAVNITSVVVLIALYHYLRIFNSWSDAFTFVDGSYIQKGAPFNEGYRYVDWLLTVPLLLAELVIVLKLAKSTTRSLITKLSIAAVAMILLGYPGELAAADSSTRTIFGILSTLPFLYLLFVLFVELGKSLDRQTEQVRKIVNGLRFMILIIWGVYPLIWGVYPLAYIAPSVISDEATAEVVRQVGYSLADILAKPLFGLFILAIALIKTHDEEGSLSETASAVSN